VSAKVIAFFNNKGGVGKTSLVYHVSWMLSDLGVRVVAADLDPQCKLTAAFMEEDRLEELWDEGDEATTVFRAVKPLVEGVGDVADPVVAAMADGLVALVPGEMMLSSFEDQLAETWPKCLDRDVRAFRVTSAFWRVVQASAESHGAGVVLLDLGPNLGGINRSCLVAADFVVVPLAPDLFSLQGLRNLGPRLRDWREDWAKRRREQPATLGFCLPEGNMRPLGYVVMQHSVRKDRPVKSCEKWMARVPATYTRYMSGTSAARATTIGEDGNCVGLLKHYRSLMPMAQEAQKPVFHLKPADGALGAHSTAVQNAYGDFRKLTLEIMRRAGVDVPA
jgi:cellulose biosynthesis protein BcsQ